MKRKLTDRQCERIRLEYQRTLAENLVGFRVRSKGKIQALARKWGISQQHTTNIGRGVYR